MQNIFISFLLPDHEENVKCLCHIASVEAFLTVLLLLLRLTSRKNLFVEGSSKSRFHNPGHAITTFGKGKGKVLSLFF